VRDPCCSVLVDVSGDFRGRCGLGRRPSGEDVNAGNRGGIAKDREDEASLRYVSVGRSCDGGRHTTMPVLPSNIVDVMIQEAVLQISVMKLKVQRKMM
jgi:hypothetical protein